LLYIPFAIIVLFQNPIRQALVRIARNPLAALLPRQRIERKIAEEVALAAASLASKRIGALIVIERELGLRTFYDTGILLDARVTYDLLMNIFTPGAPLHDGAAIIAESRIKAASCYLPLTTDPTLSRVYGTRHRAAIGITEEYDALAVVVSEERGVVSLTEDGKIVEDLDAQGLMARLSTALIPGTENGEERKAPTAEVVDSSHA
ncbi:MAG: DNA integrity scanning protein DisA nucleotide-binding domain protein, partial [Acidobacteriota bacterium]|nr:DNA integrity scanning protein DisA nucleotide-binding domain protein [Acidobacteriota bacterium]